MIICRIGEARTTANGCADAEGTSHMSAVNQFIGAPV